METAGGRMTTMLQGATMWAQRGAIAVGALGAAAVATGIKFNASMETQVTAFRGFLGSAEKTDRYVRSLYDLAAKTPFEFEDVLSGTRTLMAYGLAADEAKGPLARRGDGLG